jgi:hypothetical protein
MANMEPLKYVLVIVLETLPKYPLPSLPSLWSSPPSFCFVVYVLLLILYFFFLLKKIYAEERMQTQFIPMSPLYSSPMLSKSINVALVLIAKGYALGMLK